jgi:hypothetical protein
MRRLPKNILGSHPVAVDRLWSTAYSSGVFSVFWSFFLGVWILRHHAEMFDTESWVEFLSVIDGRKYLIGLAIFVGGTLGLAGLVFRRRALSLASCIIGILWCSWIATFLLFAAPANVGGPFALLGTSVFVHRYILLVSDPSDEDDAHHDR